MSLPSKTSIFIPLQHNNFQMPKFFFFLFALCLFAFSCKEKEDAVDVSHIQASAEIVRFDQALFSLDTNRWEASLGELKSRYPHFWGIYSKHILPLTPDSSQYDKALLAFVKDRQIRQLYDTTQLLVGKLDRYKEKTTEAFKTVKYYFPKFVEPTIYTFISEFGFQKFIFSDGNKDGIGIGLEMFLGSSYPYKTIDPTNPNFSAYLTRTFDKQYLTKKTIDLIVDDIVGSPGGVRLLDYMVYNGKKLYLLKKFLPSEPDSVIFEYTQKQMDWVVDNELEMWSFFTEQNLVYETNVIKINKYINPSPESPGMPADAPGQTANYIGYQMIRAYMEKQPNTTLDQLMAEKDAQRILELSKYKPKR